MSVIKERILQYAKYKGISYERFCESIDMAYSSFKGPGRERAINSDALDLLMSKYPKINPEWLLTGKGSMLRPIEKDFEQNDLEEQMPVVEEENDKVLLKENKDWPEATQRLRTLINRYSNGSVRDFANNLEGISQNRLNRIFNIDGRTKKYPEISSAIFSEIIRSFPSIRMEWLIMGKGEMLKEDDVKKDIESTSQVSSDCKSCNEKDKLISSLQLSINAMTRAMDEVIKSKEDALKQKEENHKLVIAQYQAEIKKLEEKEDFFDRTDAPVFQSITVEQEGTATVLKQVKKTSSPSLPQQTPNAPLDK